MTKASKKNTSYIIRPAVLDDAQGISVVLSEILKTWKSDRKSSPEFVNSFYIAHPANIQCTVAVDKNEKIIGFQSLKLATGDNIYGVTPGWGIIGTYVKLDTGRQGVGSRLFANTVYVAKESGLLKIDATISINNMQGLNYYDALGFQTYSETKDMISKFFVL